MSERLRKLQERMTGKRGEFQGSQAPTPKQIQDHINAQRGEGRFEDLLEHYPPSEYDIDSKQQS